MAETAEKVGYKNLSKLAAVLIKQFGCPPLEHHRRARLSRALLSKVGFDFIEVRRSVKVRQVRRTFRCYRPSIRSFQFRIRSSIYLVLPMLQWAWPFSARPGTANSRERVFFSRSISCL